MSKEAVQIRRRAPLPVFAFHFVQERIRSYRLRSFLADLIARTRPSLTIHADSRDIDNLNVDGLCVLDGLVDDNWIEDVREQLTQKLCQDRWRKENGLFDIKNVPSTAHVADINDILDIPEILQIANHPRIIGAVSSYFGCEPTIDSIKAWWSLPGHQEPENEQFFHRDNDSIRFIKLFIYLTNVDEGSGPHVFVKGSHKDDRFSERRRYQDDEIVDFYGKDKITTLRGDAGTAFLEDTFGLHKGELPTEERRLLMQVRYSVVPSIFMSRRKSKVVEDQVIRQGYSTYSNRLMS